MVVSKNTTKTTRAGGFVVEKIFSKLLNFECSTQSWTDTMFSKTYSE